MKSAENHLIELLPRAERIALLKTGQRVDLVLSEVLCEPHVDTRQIYFPIDGFISLVTMLNGKPALEVGMIGREGMLGIQVLLGIHQSPVQALVQGGGSAWKFDSRNFVRNLQLDSAMATVLRRYLYVRVCQLTGAAACLRYHLISQRLARWLLMSHDRARSDSFSVTHEFLAYMLGVRRVGVTTAAGKLQSRGLITYHRGHLTVLNRKGLEQAACSCYDADQHAYLEML